MPGPDDKQGPLGPDIDRFMRFLTLERGRSANTVAAYRADLAQYEKWLEDAGVADLQAITGAHVEGFAQSLTGSARTVQRRLSAVRSFHAFLVDDDRLPANPSLGIAGPSSPGRLPKALGVAVVQSLLDSVSADEPIALRDRALLEVLYGTGARVSEVVGLAVDDVYTGEGATSDLLRVVGKGNKERIVPLGSHARQALEAYLTRSRPILAKKSPRGTPALFLGSRGSALSRQSVWNVLKKRAKDAGISEPLSPHTLRHSCATHLVAGGADIRVVQELLGHQSVQTTQIYTKVTIDSLRDVFYTAHPRARS